MKLYIFLSIIIFTLSAQGECFRGRTIPPNCEMMGNCGKNNICTLRCFPVTQKCICKGEPCCTLTQGGWENSKKGCEAHPEECAKLLCNRTYLEILEDNSIQENAWLILAHQCVSAVLNVITNNACTLANVNITLFNSNISLINDCDTQFISTNSAKGIIMIEQAIVLDEFNNGKLGVDHCD